MGKADRKRWEGNVRSMAIVAKPPEEITEEDVQFLRESYTSAGGLLPNAFSGGAFFTPTHVARFMVETIAGLSGGLTAGTCVLEPSAGSGVFLEHIPPDCEVTALELDETSAKVTKLIYPHVNVINADALTHERRDYYDIVIGNPPYGLTLETERDDFTTLSKSKGKYRGKSENVFIELAIKAAKPGGYIAFVLPMGISYANYSAKIRKYMHETCWHIATIHLPGETFQHVGTTIATQILIIRKAPPDTPLIEPATKRWGSSFKRGGYGAITQHDARFLAGQLPSYFAVVTDIGLDAKGRRTDSAQLDDLLVDFTDDGLVRENLYPHIPSWYGIGKGNDAFFFSHGNDSCDGYRDGSQTYADGPYRWNELTLGAGEEINGNSTWDFGWMDRIVAKYYERTTIKEAA
ncbi:N-6 DNA methylase [Brevibacillus laterosporus]|uniref:HsdM family class I SAM-dependent methyltransferase n=1 Tax=Brevibacillus laterosporus TaxID=1465 RepID=UPI000371C388|nr:N-6 DNA methylase [Brevibacillus laterosporus]ATO51015.1 hypothetical protein BrL25_19090 [Brevibacillus laterosporus DSM 25]MED2004723.1 N-6 DNA methylase [Brevibacillus laterosporus]